MALGPSAERAQMWVVRRPRSLDSVPPKARTAPAMASLSVTGISSHVKLTSEKSRRGSGEYGRICACRFLRKDTLTQAGLTTGTIIAMASLYSGKSIVQAIMWLQRETGRFPSSSLSTIWAPYFSTKVFSCKLVSVTAPGCRATRQPYRLGQILGQFFADDEGD